MKKEIIKFKMSEESKELAWVEIIKFKRNGNAINHPL